MNDLFSKAKIISSLNFIFTSSAALVLIYLIIFLITAIVHPAPLEFREGTAVATTSLIMKGQSLYTLQNLPIYQNLYGVLFNIFAIPLSAIMGIGFIPLRIISAIFTILTCGVFLFFLKIKNISGRLSFYAVIILFSYLLTVSFLGARPDTMGMFFFLTSIYLPLKYNHSPISIILSVVMGLIAFLTKPYFILSIVIVGLYEFLWISKKKGLLYFFISSILIVVLLITLNIFYSNYITATILENANLASNILFLPFSQIKTFARLNFFILISFFFSFFQFVITHRGEKNFTLKGLINLNKMSKPLFSYKIDLILFGLIFMFFLFIFKFGRHDGNYLGYFYGLVAPFVLIKGFEYLAHYGMNIHNQILGIVLSLLIVLNIMLIPFFIIKPIPNNKAEWNAISELISKKKNIFSGPATVALLVEKDRPIYDNGHSDTFEAATKSSSFGGIIIPADENIKKRWKSYIQKIEFNTQTKQYDLVLLSKGYSPLLDKKLLKVYYDYKGLLSSPIYFTEQFNKLEIWEPKQ